MPDQWDKLPVEERTRLMATFRDFSDLKRIDGMSKEQQSNLRGMSEWVVLDKGNGHG